MKGPILVLGAGGFIGSSIFKSLQPREDVYGTITEKHQSWRLGNSSHLIQVDLLKDIEWLLLTSQPGTIINCAAYGSFPDEKNVSRIYATNLDLVHRILYKMGKECSYVHAGTSSEYGFNSAGPKETERLTPNSDYAVSKAAASQLIEYAGKQLRYKCCNLRLYSVYGPYEAATRLMPKLVAAGHKKQFPLLVNPNISRDFVYIDDVVKAFVSAADAIENEHTMWGESYNICTGVCTRIAELAYLSREIFGIEAEPEYSMPPRRWDSEAAWYGNPEKAYSFWWFDTDLRKGLIELSEWYGALQDKSRYELYSKK